MLEETESLISLMDTGDSELGHPPVHLPGDVKHVKLVTSSPCHRHGGVGATRNGGSPNPSPSKSALKKPVTARLAAAALSHQDGVVSDKSMTSSLTRQSSPGKRRMVTETGDVTAQQSGSALLLPAAVTSTGVLCQNSVTGHSSGQGQGTNEGGEQQQQQQQQVDAVSLQSSVGSDGTVSERYLAMRGSPNKTTWLLKNWHDSRPSSSSSSSFSSPRQPGTTGSSPRYAARIGSGNREDIRSYRSIVSRSSAGASSASRQQPHQLQQQRVVEGDSQGTEIVVALGIVVSGAVCLLVSISGGGGVWTAAGVASVSIGGLAMTVGILRAKYNKQVEQDKRRMHIELLRTRSVDTRRSSDSGARLV